MKQNKIIFCGILLLMLIVCFGCQKDNETIPMKPEELSVPFAADEIKSIAVWYSDTDETIRYGEGQDITAFVEVLNQLALDQIEKISDMSPRYPGMSLEIRGEDGAACKMIIHGMYALVIKTVNEETNLSEYTYYTVDCMNIINLAEQKRMQYAEIQEP